MLKFYYTGAGEHLGSETSPQQSLGGYISSKLVPNDALNVLFGEITLLTLQRNNRLIRGVAIKNEGNEIAEDVEIWFQYPNEDRHTKFKIAAQVPVSDSCGDPILEKVPNQNAKPYNLTFYEADGEINKVNVGDIQPDEYLGIFLQREFLSSAVKFPDCEVLDQQYTNDEDLPKEETVTMVIKYNEGGSESISGSLSLSTS